MSGFEVTKNQQKKNSQKTIGLMMYMLTIYAAAVSFWCGILSVFPIEAEPVVVYGGQLLVVLLWTLVFRLKKGKKAAVLLVLCLCMVCGFLTRGLLADGINHVVNTYISHHNVFYSASQPLLEDTGSAAGRMLAVFLIQMALTGVLAAVLSAGKGMLAALIVLILPFAIPATVGYMPSSLEGWAVIGSALLYFLVYTQTDKALLKREIQTAGCVFAVVVGAAALIQPRIVKVREANSDTYLDIHNKLIDAQQVDLGTILTGTFLGNANYSVGGIGKGDLRNLAENRPQGTKDMEIVVDEEPQGRIYLKAYVGAEYDGKQWKEPSEREFNRMLKSAGAQGKGAELFGEPFKRLKEKMSRIEAREMEIKLLNASDEFAYSPYYAEIKEDDSVYADAYIQGRGKNERHYTYFEASEVEALHTGILGGGTDAWEEYQDYVKSAYTKEKDELVRLKDYCKDIDNLSLESVTQSIDAKFSQNLQYTRAPGAYPSDEDFAEYFLTESKKGFCVHFATAATLIYRECGYPSRYVEGYAVPPSAFERQEDGTYKAVVTDGMAHAWCETFDANVGWQVKEHTAQFSSNQNWTTESADEEEQADTEQEEDQQIDTEQPRTEEPPETQDIQDIQDIEPEENQQTAEPEKPDNQEDGLSGLPGGGDGPGEGSGAAIGGTLLKVAAGGVIFFGVAVLLALICIIQQKIRMQKKKYQFRQKAQNRGIKNIFRDIHKIALFAGLKDKDLNDREALKQMQTKCPELSREEWEWLCDCALRAAFAEGQLEKTEQQKMYNLYHKFRKAVIAGLTAKKKFIFIFIRGL